jgi:hypothetical protein
VSQPGVPGNKPTQAITVKGAKPARTEILYGQHDDSPNEWDPEAAAAAAQHGSSGGDILVGRKSSGGSKESYDDAVRVDIDGHGWKLIEGWGGKPNSWSQLVKATDEVPVEAVACEAACCIDRPEEQEEATAAAASARGDPEGPGSPAPAPAYNKTLILFGAGAVGNERR